MNHETSITKFFHIDKSLQASYIEMSLRILSNTNKINDRMR
jgi:hypothetical protein